MPHSASRQVFYPGLMVIVTAVYAMRGVTWIVDTTPGRASGVEWVVGWMSTDVVGVLWLAAAAASMLAAVSVARHRRNCTIILGALAVFIPALVAMFFFGSTVVFFLDPTPGSPPPGAAPSSWWDRGNPRGWITGVEYTGWALVGMWGLMVHTGTTTMLTRIWKALRRETRGDHD